MIYIFGDSFSVEEPDDISFNGERGLCWYELIKRREDSPEIINYSSKGEGSYASMEKLYHLVENNEIKLDDKTIVKMDKATAGKVLIGLMNMKPADRVSALKSMQRTKSGFDKEVKKLVR